MNISVAMATYNGEKYIKEQIESIICQLNDEDELIISDDGSTDRTLDIVNTISEKHKYIKIINGPKKGFMKNFENALNHCENEIVFLSDQDDIWKENKVEVIKKHFEENIDTLLILHNMSLLYEAGTVKKSVINFKKGLLSNIISSCYWGCCIAFKKELMNEILPFPKSVPAHDQWIGLCAERLSGASFIKEDLIMHRIHNNNKTRKQNIYKKIIFRLKLLISLLRL